MTDFDCKLLSWLPISTGVNATGNGSKAVAEQHIKILMLHSEYFFQQTKFQLENGYHVHVVILVRVI